LGDKAFSSKAIRRNLRRRGITATIPELADQIKHRDSMIYRTSSSRQSVMNAPDITGRI
jgi:hypothetical protein